MGKRLFLAFLVMVVAPLVLSGQGQPFTATVFAGHTVTSGHGGCACSTPEVPCYPDFPDEVVLECGARSTPQPTPIKKGSPNNSGDAGIGIITVLGLLLLIWRIRS